MRIAHTHRRARHPLAVFLFSVLLALPVMAMAADKAEKPGKDARVDRLNDLVVRAIPLGMIFDDLARRDPQWPMQAKPDAVSKNQLRCLRRELSDDGYRKAKRADVVTYIGRYPSAVDQDIRVLDDGAAMMMGKLMMAGVEQERTGIEVDQNALMSEAEPEQLAAFMSFMTSPDHASLRGLAGIGNAFDSGRSAEENENAGEAAGADLATKVILRAMGSCDVPTSVLFE